MRAVSVPLGLSDPDKPNISYYYDNAYDPSSFWVDLDKVDFK